MGTKSLDYHAASPDIDTQNTIIRVLGELWQTARFQMPKGVCRLNIGIMRAGYVSYCTHSSKFGGTHRGMP